MQKPPYMYVPKPLNILHTNSYVPSSTVFSTRRSSPSTRMIKRGIPGSNRPQWSYDMILDRIQQDPHESTLDPMVTNFFHQELCERVHQGVRIFLTLSDALQFFNKWLKLTY